MAEARDLSPPDTAAPVHPRDPLAWCLALTGLYALLAGWRLAIPSIPFFDEVHYLPAARELLALMETGSGTYLNREHPLLGKELIAVGMALLGDNPLGWRIMPLACGTLVLFAGMRALWHASEDRFATIAFGVLLATGFHLFVQSRITMLDIFMAAFLAVAAWQFAGACAQPEKGRWRLALTGLALGCAMGAKWNAIPLAMLPGLAFFAARLSAGRRRLFMSRRGAPVPGITLVEAFVWLGIVPLLAYALTFAPGWWLGGYLRPSPLAEAGLIGFHREILSLQQQVITPHNYQSTWPQWLLNTRGIWYLYEVIDGSQRGVLLIGNPLTMLAGLPALAWCLASGAWRGDWTKLAVVIGYGAALGLWLIAPKPVQFYYHYFVPHFFLLAALALSLSDLRRAGLGQRLGRWLAWGMLAGSAGLFALFYKVLAAAPLEGAASFAKWTWLAGWR
ncbi:phospholipid carrier-dependent glycosyltransferase [Erythrobacter sanguineus]|uniref:Polyprenol-phosphate-mannose--protein mannosyltransferase n=1 Tax=Erythrobacter sanguineus TaxID=198312 RepID=A0A1M7S1L4_9SPHN|nr:phospholipid carrier-dependent glycosyltransferase [Erythrobacter sanguineus]SHN52254.1 Dolichyl-phosphate-mannose-protein mannosyltransferase [Erythrobacter sanguineus]